MGPTSSFPGGRSALYDLFEWQHPAISQRLNRVFSAHYSVVRGQMHFHIIGRACSVVTGSRFTSSHLAFAAHRHLPLAPTQNRILPVSLSPLSANVYVYPQMNQSKPLRHSHLGFCIHAAHPGHPVRGVLPATPSSISWCVARSSEAQHILTESLDLLQASAALPSLTVSTSNSRSRRIHLGRNANVERFTASPAV